MAQNKCDYDWGLKQLHAKLLEELVYIDEFCSENGIEYCLAYGSALGAKRHKGFIPWDDDVDIYMTLDGYEKFRELFKHKGNSDYYLQEIRPVNGMISDAKLRINNTTYLEQLYKNYDMHQGIYIDIFILFPAPKQKLKKMIMNVANQYLVLKELSNRRYKARKAYIPIFALMRLFPKNCLRKTALSIIYKYRNSNSVEFYDTDLRKYNRSFWKKETIFPVRKTDFENVQFYIPNDIETYLTKQYGNYMEIPSIESIKRAQHSSLWKTDEDFRKYAKNIKDYRDERE